MYDFHVSETTRYCTDHEEPCPLPCPGCDADCDPSFMVDAGAPTRTDHAAIREALSGGE